MVGASDCRDGTSIPVALLTAIALALGGPAPASACTCGPMPSVSEGFAAASLVFQGTVVGIDHEWLPRQEGVAPWYEEVRYTFRVDRAWKGAHLVGDSGEVVLEDGSGMCGVGSPVAVPTVLFAYPSTRNSSRLRMPTICDRGAPHDIDELGEPTAQFGPQALSVAERLLSSARWQARRAPGDPPPFELLLNSDAGFLILRTVDGASVRERGLFDLQGADLDLVVLLSTDERRVGLSIASRVTVHDAEATFTNAPLLTGGLTDEPTITLFRDPPTSIEPAGWGLVKAGRRD